MLLTSAVPVGAVSSEAPLCGDGVIEEGETCDDGGTCLGGANHGLPCPASTGGFECGRGFCRPAGGDGCAKNCTREHSLVFRLSESGDATSHGFGQTATFGFEFPVPGRLVFTIGEPTGASGSRSALSSDSQFIPGDIPVVLRSEENGGQIPPLPIAGSLGCQCLRPREARS
jgi:hypothetical protein